MTEGMKGEREQERKEVMKRGRSRGRKNGWSERRNEIEK